MNRFLGFAALALIALFSACTSAPKPPLLVLRATDFSSLSAWSEAGQAEALSTFMNSCTAFEKKPANSAMGQGALAMPASYWQEVCAAAFFVPVGDDAAAREFFETRFVPYAASNYDEYNGTFTGYYEPTLRGSRVKTSRYSVPIYGLPAGKKDYTREEIDKGALAGKGLELFYTDDAVDLFFLQVQGSGRLWMEDGSEVRLSYNGQNGHPYVGIGKLLRDRKWTDDASMQGIKAWIRANPEEGKKLMWENPSYVFFKVNPNNNVVGAQGVPLTPERSLAVDRRFIPYGSPLFIETKLPGGADFTRLMVAQDTGGAIKGPVRADVYFGNGERAEWTAGHMKQDGRWFVLVPSQRAAELGPEARSSAPQ